jgi:hypothetical protein
MERNDQRPVGADGHLANASCDYCGHEHACYVGGRPPDIGYPGSPGWERHVCLGCLMRAGVRDGFATCTDCRVPDGAPR